jgi:hypothetical protein
MRAATQQGGQSEAALPGESPRHTGATTSNETILHSSNGGQTACCPPSPATNDLKN